MNKPARLLLSLAVAAACGVAHAGGVDNARQRGKLIAAVGHVAPEYKGGMKFRTPESLDTVLAGEVAKRLKLPLAPLRADAGQLPQQLASGKADFALVAVPAGAPLHRVATVIPTGYVAAPMAIMRTDTDIKSWEQLKGRKVCLSEGGLYAGMLAAKYGAVEMPQRAPADSLLAVRTGSCDAAVHDSAMLEELVRLPEWKKFSARLPAGPGVPLSFVVAPGDDRTAGMLIQAVRQWRANGFLAASMQKVVRHIAFEVYLDQDVPDCH